MLKYLGRLIEKHPWLVVSAIIFITIGFSILLPSLEMKTDFSDFMPEDKIVQANSRIYDYFGGSKQITLLHVEKQDTNSVISTKALKEQFYLQEKLNDIQEVDYTFGITSIVDQLCQLEFGKKFNNCTDSELETVLRDILRDNGENSIQIFNVDDPNEETDYKRYPKISWGSSVDAVSYTHLTLPTN